MYKIFSWLVGTLSPQNQKDISQVKKMITDESSLQVIRQKVPLQMWENKELLDLLIKKHLEGAICKTFQAENIAKMKKEWESVSFLLNLLEQQRSKDLIEDHKEDSTEVIEVKLDNDVIIEDQPEDQPEDLDDLIKLIKEHNTEDFDDLIKLIRADQPEVFDELIRADQLEESAELIIEDLTEPNSAIATELSRQELLGHYLCTTIALVTKRQYDMVSHHIDDKDLINCMHSFQKNIIQILLKNKANPNIKIESSTPLSWVAGQGDDESMKLLLADPRVDLNSKTSLGNTPLYFAVACNNLEGIKLLLAAPGLDPNIKNNEGNTVLHLAREKRFYESIKLLLAAPEVDPNIKYQNGYTALHWAWKMEDFLSVELLLAAPGVDPNIQDNNGSTVLNWAAQHQYDKNIKLLLAHPGVDPNIKDIHGYTPLHWARETRAHKNMELLLADPRVDPNIKDIHGYTPLHWAVRNKDPQSIELLLGHERLDPNIQNNLGNTALHWAIITDNALAISLLIDKGARLDIKNHLGKTPLHDIINLDLDSEQNGSNKLIQILDALPPKALSNIYCALQDQRCDQGKKDQLNKYMLQRNSLNQDLMPKIVQKQIHVKKFLQNTHNNLFGGKAAITQCEGKVENENESERLKEIMKEPFFRQSANSFSTLISKIELQSQGDSDASSDSIFKEHKPPTLYQPYGDNLAGELANLSHDACGMDGAIVPYHPESR